MISTGIYMVAINLFPGESLIYFAMGITAAFIIASIFLLFRTSETKDADLYTVGSNEEEKK